ncbi:MAG: single-stranded DNA-binding protein [Huintestinicola sp.]|uniref:single-stranded DNA-binding protein n=1 Tax=Huintestinicola sp. TaxID=2981661 RepID=UPI003F0AF35E
MLNKVILMGRLTADPELRQTQSGVNSCRFTVAVDRNFVPQGGERQADFITCIAWRQTAEFVSRYFSKGRMICVEGNLRTGSYDDRNHPDVKHYTTDVYVDSVYFAGDKPQNNGQGGNYQQGGYNNNYQQNNYGGQGGYSQPQGQPAYQQSAPAPSVSVGDLSDFEEVISDSDLPF